MAKKTAKTKKEKINLPNGSQGFYHKNNIFLKPADNFIYEMMVHEMMPNGSFMVDNKETSIKEFKGYQFIKIIEKGKKRYMQSVDLVCAPLDFLIENKFKLIE